jgi:hypothetical protein
MGGTNMAFFAKNCVWNQIVGPEPTALQTSKALIETQSSEANCRRKN